MVFLTELGIHACFCLEFWSSCVGRRKGGCAFKCRASQLVFYPDISFLGMIFIWIGKKPYQVGCYLYLFEILYWLVIRWLHSLGRLQRWFSCFKLNKFRLHSQGLLPERFFFCRCLCQLTKQFRVLMGWRQTYFHSYVGHTCRGSEPIDYNCLSCRLCTLRSLLYLWSLASAWLLSKCQDFYCFFLG